MADELKPCPFCGSDSIRVECFAEKYYKYVVVCNNCGVKTGNEHIEAIAIAAWNRRAGNGENITV